MRCQGECWWRGKAIIAVRHASCVLDLLNQTFLGEGQCAIRKILSEVDAVEVGERALASEDETF